MSESDDQNNPPQRKDSSALDRYLRRENSPSDPQASSAQPVSQPVGLAPAAAAGGVPGAASGGPTHLDLNLSSAPGVAFAAASPGRRLVALIIDNSIVGLMSFPFQMLVQFAMPKKENITSDTADILAALVPVFTAGLLTMVASWSIVFFYFGWFYKHKGASPGKLVMGIKVLDSRNGTHLSYWQSFAREAFVKTFISGYFTLFIGYLIAFFREDRKALHDIICSTQVMRVKK